MHSGNLVNKMEVVCDTNIWYGLGNNLIDEPSGDVSLILHWLTASELLTSNKITTNQAFMRNTMNFIFKKGLTIYQCPPLDHIASFINTEHKCDGWDMSEKLKDLYFKLNDPLYKSNDDLNIDKVAIYIDLKAKLALETNQNSQSIKELIKDKSQYRAIDNTVETKNFIMKEVNTYFGKALLNIDRFNWKQIELYFETMKTVSIMLATGATVLKENDLIDLFQLIYVQPGKLFWTKDKKLKDFITQAKMNHYLFNPA